MTTWVQLDPRFRQDNLGWLVDILTDSDKRPIREQLDDRYAHGGGYRPMNNGRQKFRLNPKTLVMRFPGDAPFLPAALAKINDELVVFYPYCSLLAIIQPGGTFEVTRVD